MNKFESRFGAIRDEENMLAVKKSMPESLLNYRFRGTTMSYSEIIIALENIIIDKVAMVPTAKGKRHDTVVITTRLGFHRATFSDHVCKHLSYCNFVVKLYFALSG